MVLVTVDFLIALNKEQNLAKGLIIVARTRSPFGAGTPSRELTTAKFSYVHLIQSRIMLQLSIVSGFNQNWVTLTARVEERSG